MSNCCFAYCLYTQCIWCLIARLFFSYIVRSEKFDLKTPFKWVLNANQMGISSGYFVTCLWNCTRGGSTGSLWENGFPSITTRMRNDSRLAGSLTVVHNWCIVTSILTNTEIRSRFCIKPISPVPRATRKFKSLMAWPFRNEAQLGHKVSRMITMSWQKRRICMHVWTVWHVWSD